MATSDARASDDASLDFPTSALPNAIFSKSFIFNYLGDCRDGRWFALLPARLKEILDAPRVVVASKAMTELLSMAERAAQSSAKVLITGESGVGKDVVARHIHSHSARKHAPFVAVNCAGVTETLLESELFGHVKGSFTGAYRDKRGKLQIAHRGTLFLDEVGEMSLRMQALLLRFLENGEIQAVGSDQTQSSVDVRVIAAT